MRIPQGEFRLDPEFLSNFKTRQPDWGPLGYLTYKRTYAADLPDGTSEEFWQTCQRVIEGMFQILEGHCRNYHLPWSAEKAQIMAQDAFERMFAFKWLPPGRGLSKMGTESMRKVGGACLNNCFSGDTEIFIHTGGRTIETRKLRDCIAQEFVNIVLPGRRYIQANVQSFGIQRLQKITLAPSLSSDYQIEYDVTPEHRWILSNGASTTNLSIGDEILVIPDGVQDSKMNAEAYRAGYDDWCRYQADDVGENVVSKVKPEQRTLDYQRGFFEAWVDTGVKLETGDIQVRTADLHFTRWAAERAPLLGFCVKDTASFKYKGRSYYALTVSERPVSYRVTKISEGAEEEVFCPVVPDENKFMLAGGIVTGNCGFVSTKNIGNKDVEDSFSAPFCWLMDMSMLGVGVGFDTKGAGKVVIRKPDVCEPFLVGDSRSGWVEYVKNLFESYVNPHVPFPMADYSNVREKGAKINGFGGTASGPESLVRLTDRTVKLLDALDGKTITSSAIVDLANFLGECVVSGGVRRTAEISFGAPNDAEFLSLKDYENNPEASELPRWASNNSVIVNGGPVDFDLLSSYTARNGEPGYLFLDNARRYGRMIDPEDHSDMHAEGANPCVTGDTLVAVADGRNAVPIRQLAEEGKDVPVYSLNLDAGKLEVKWGRAPRVTRKDAELVRVHLGKDGYVDCTPNHRFILRDGTWKYAKDLEKGDSLSSNTKRQEVVAKGGNKYWQVETDTATRTRVFEHRLIADFFDSETKDKLYEEGTRNGWIQGGLVVHHKNYDPLDNRPENLQWMTFRGHAAHHASVDNKGEKNGMFGKEHSEETKRKIGDRTLERTADPEFRAKLSASHTKAERAASSKRMKEQKADWDYQRALEFEAETDLETFWVGRKLHATRVCEHCETKFSMPWSRRHRPYCSQECFVQYLANLEKRKNNQRQYFEDKQKETLHKQVMKYKDLQEAFGRDPMKKEWETACRDEGISFRFRSASSATNNPHALRSFGHLKNLSAGYNCRVTGVEVLSHREDVYCLTVDDNHTFTVVPSWEEGAKCLKLLNNTNCVEQTLWDRELCTLVENFPSRCDDYEDFAKTLKCSYLYAKVVTMIPTHNPQTNAVMTKNRRIGCSQSGIWDNIHRIGFREHIRWCDQGYREICAIDEDYSNWLGIPKSIKKTSIKPSGTISKLVGAREGIHQAKGEYEIQSIRLNENSPLIPRLREANIKIETAVYEPNTVVAYFPMHWPGQSERPASMWEQLELAAQMQAYWADNQVSVTVDFDPKTEGPQIGLALEMYASRVKGLSFLPRTAEEHYVQLPKRVCTREEYEEYKGSIKDPDFSNLRTHEAEDLFCDGTSCTLPQAGNPEAVVASANSI